MGKTTNTRVYNSKLLSSKPFPGDKCTSLDTETLFCKVEDGDKSDIEDEAVIHVKIDKSGASNKQNLKRLKFPVIIFFGHRGPRVVRMLHKIMVGVFEHLGITNWGVIYQSWMYVDQFLKLQSLTKFRNSVIA